MEGVEYRTTTIRDPQTSGFVERVNRTLIDEYFRVQRRTPVTSKSMSPS
jgi:hypothetical protein